MSIYTRCDRPHHLSVHSMNQEDITIQCVKLFKYTVITYSFITGAAASLSEKPLCEWCGHHNPVFIWYKCLFKNLLINKYIKCPVTTGATSPAISVFTSRIKWTLQDCLLILMFIDHRCDQPHHLRGYSVNEVDFTQFSCSFFTVHRFQVEVGLILLITAVFISMAAFLVYRFRHSLLPCCYIIPGM